MANSKLTPEQKMALANFKHANPHILFLTDGLTTIARERVGSNVIFATAIMSEDENKYRRKVGQYHALERLTNGKYAMLTSYDFGELVKNMMMYS